jgi:hypothetical protein
MLPRKKRKIEDAIFKMNIGTPEHEMEQARRQNALWRKEKRIDKMKSFCNFCGVGLAIILAISVVLAAILCPIIFYTETEVLFTVQNVSDAQYAYILNGDSSMHLRYYGETRNLENNDIEFHIMVAHCWNHIEKIEIWAARGNVSCLGVKEIE